MQRWKLTLEYDGAGFYGWQRQDDAVSVQQSVEEAIAGFSKEDVRLHVAGRTDTGVHALAQIAHFDLERPTDGDTVRDALNYYLKSKPVVVLKAEAVDDNFHARFSAKARSYHYHVMNRRVPLALARHRAWHVIKPLDENLMQQAAHMLIGTHDFSTFRAASCQSKSPIKTMEKASVERDGQSVHFWFLARSFLYHQVRNMVGTLVMVGTQQWSLGEFKSAFDARDRTKGGPTAPAHALTFISVDYD